MLEKPKTIIKHHFEGCPPKIAPAAHTLACCNGGVTVKNGFVFVFCLGGAGPQMGQAPGRGPLTEESKTLGPKREPA